MIHDEGKLSRIFPADHKALPDVARIKSLFLVQYWLFHIKNFCEATSIFRIKINYFTKQHENSHKLQMAPSRVYWSEHNADGAWREVKHVHNKTITLIGT